MLVPFRDAGHCGRSKSPPIQPALMAAMRKRHGRLGREMIWSVVARRYMESFERARVRLTVPPRKPSPCGLWTIALEFPPLKLDHLFRMTDHTGIFQHAIYNVPNY